jgi:hypothetical protein
MYSNKRLDDPDFVPSKVTFTTIFKEYPDLKRIHNLKIKEVNKHPEFIEIKKKKFNEIKEVKNDLLKNTKRSIYRLACQRRKSTRAVKSKD